MKLSFFGLCDDPLKKARFYHSPIYVCMIPSATKCMEITRAGRLDDDGGTYCTWVPAADTEFSHLLTLSRYGPAANGGYDFGKWWYIHLMYTVLLSSSSQSSGLVKQALHWAGVW